MVPRPLVDRKSSSNCMGRISGFSASLDVERGELFRPNWFRDPTDQLQVSMPVKLIGNG
jgi:hypothetical protein